MAALVARATQLGGLGLDLETWLSNERAASLEDHIARPGELDALGEARSARGELLTLVFSAKECLYKALFPQVRRWFGFQDAEVCALDPVEGSGGVFHLQLRTALSPALPSGTSFEGRWTRTPDLLLTVLTLPPRPFVPGTPESAPEPSGS